MHRAVVQDAGANIGFIISSSGFQSGAYDAVQATNIKLLTWTKFQEEFFKRWLQSMTKKVGIIVDPICEYFDPFGKIMRGLNGTEERVKRAENLWEKFRLFHHASPYLNGEINGRVMSYLRFPMKGIDPRGDIKQLDEITIETPREYFDLILSEHENALRAFEQFTSELKKG